MTLSRTINRRAHPRARIAAWSFTAMLLLFMWVIIPSSVFAAKATKKSGSKVSKSKEQPVSLANRPGRKTPGRDRDDHDFKGRSFRPDPHARPTTWHNPRELRLQRATKSFNGDLRDLPYEAMPKLERVEREGPAPTPEIYKGSGNDSATESNAPSSDAPAQPSSSAPSTVANFDGLDFNTYGNGHPTDQNGDVGPNYYIQTINTSIGIFNKSTGALVNAFSFNTFMSKGNFGNICDNNNYGDPVVLYDTFEDRWVITDFAFQLDASGNVSPPHALQCFAVSKTGDPVSGGWNYYSIETLGGLGDYPKFGIWPDGIYMAANMFDYAASGGFQNPRVYALNKQQMYTGSPTVQVVSFDAPSDDFTLLPSNARLQTGTPPTGTPNYYISTWQYLNAVTIYQFHVDWNNISLSTFTGPTIQAATTCWPNASVANAPTPKNALDVLQIRAMMQNQYSNINGVESLWASHTVRRGEAPASTCNAATTGSATVRWYQLDVTGGNVSTTALQGKSWDPEGANTYHRYMPSLAVDRVGNMAIGYSLSNATTNPSIRYAGRLATDPVNTFSQSEQVLIDGAGSQTGNCGGSACTRWGDYSAMSLDPDGCTFWYTNGYFSANDLNDKTRIGSFKYDNCVPVGAGGTVSGTVTSAGNVALSGATVSLGARTTTTDASGKYSFSGIPAGTYPSITAAAVGFGSQTLNSIVVSDNSTTTKNFVLAAAAQSNCFVDTTQADFYGGIPTKCDLTSSPGDVTLVDAPVIDQQNQSVTGNGFGFTNTSWAGQTFTVAKSGKLTRVDLEMFCSGCSGTNPDVTVSIRATSGTTPVPTGADLATATLTGFNDSGAGGFKTVTFSPPLNVTAGTRYAVIFRSTAARTGSYAYTCSCTSPNSNPYTGGQRVTSTTSGATWTADTTSGGRDLKFQVWIDTGYPSSGTFISSVKDANPAGSYNQAWGNLTYTVNTPAGTSVNFQAAASNNPNGPFVFVGPDGTAATSFNSGDSLAQFNGKRYLRYQATLNSTDSSKTPAVNDVKVCFANQAETLSVAPASGAYAGPATLTATLTSGGNPVSGKNITFAINGTTVGSGTTDVNGVATANITINIGGGTWPLTASFAGDSSYVPTSGSSTITVTATPASLSASVVLTKLGNGDYQGVLTITNTGGSTASNVTLTKATLGTANGNPIPQNLGNLGAGTSVSATIIFPATAGASGATVVETYQGSYTGGTFGLSVRAKLP